MSKWNILLDFDRTVAGGHSGGRDFTERSPMDKANKRAFLLSLNKWLQAGHNVVIVTRGIDVLIRDYFTRILRVAPVMYDILPGHVSIYAPDEELFNSDGSVDFWATVKREFVSDILSKLGSDGSRTVFMDDTRENVALMAASYPLMTCVTATAGDYLGTYETVNRIIAGL
jgi:hypothetical protein